MSDEFLNMVDEYTDIVCGQDLPAELEKLLHKIVLNPDKFAQHMTWPVDGVNDMIHEDDFIHFFPPLYLRTSFLILLEGLFNVVLAFYEESSA